MVRYDAGHRGPSVFRWAYGERIVTVLGDQALWGGIGAVVTAAGVGAAIVRDRRSSRREAAEDRAKQSERLDEIKAQNAEQLRRQSDFEDDWYGVADRPGVPGRPGAMVRLQTIETQTKSMPDRMKALEDEQAAQRTELANIRTWQNDHQQMQHGHMPPAIVIPAPSQQAGMSS